MDCGVGDAEVASRSFISVSDLCPVNFSALMPVIEKFSRRKSNLAAC